MGRKSNAKLSEQDGIVSNDGFLGFLLWIPVFTRVHPEIIPEGRGEMGWVFHAHLVHHLGNIPFPVSKQRGCPFKAHDADHFVGGGAGDGFYFPVQTADA